MTCSSHLGWLAAVGLLVASLEACAPPPPEPEPSLELPSTDGATPVWPRLGADVQSLPLDVSDDFGVRRIYLDPGHGTGDNLGSRTVLCEQEETVTLRIAEDLADRLEATGLFEVRIARTDADGPSYARRVSRAAAWGADAFLSIHTDVRGYAWHWSPKAGLTCPRNDHEPGFAILWSTGLASPDLVHRRQRLAHTLAERMAQTGLTPYSGVNYGGLYWGEDVAGSFIARRRLYVLRAPSMPSVIIETHHGLHKEEWSRWREPRTLDAFASAVAAALVDTLSEEGA